VVARRRHFALGWPAHLWRKLDQAEQQGVIDRQQALFDAMQRTSARESASALK